MARQFHLLPAEPLIAHVKRAARDAALRSENASGCDLEGANAVGIKHLARFITEKVGGSLSSRERALYRLVSLTQPRRFVDERIADEICIGLGMHPQEVWPVEWPELAQRPLDHVTQRRRFEEAIGA